MGRVETVPGEVAGDVGAHEVDTEKLELGLELEGEQADVRDLLDMSRERRGGSLKVAQVRRMARCAQVGIRRQNRVARRQRDDFGRRGPPKPVTRMPFSGSGGCVNGTVTKADLMSAAPR